MRTSICNERFPSPHLGSPLEPSEEEVSLIGCVMLYAAHGLPAEREAALALARYGQLEIRRRSMVRSKA